MKRALISVSDKKGIVDFAKRISDFGYEIISTGGTLEVLLKNNIKASAVSDITGFPEILEGRVKTLHPKIHGGLLFLRENEEHLRQINEHFIIGIDLLVVNLYPFEETVRKHILDIQEKKSNHHLLDSEYSEEIIENIDIGGPAMLRAGAKNFKAVTVLIDPADYDCILNELEKKGTTSVETRLRLAAKVFEHISRYDYLINSYLTSSYSQVCEVPFFPFEYFHFPTKLRYGENPHQKATYFQKSITTTLEINEQDIISQIHGKELSYNNYLDIDAALKTIIKFSEPTVAIFKHTNPSGIASDPEITIAYQKAFATDTVSPFGGIIVTNEKIHLDFVEAIDKVFTEIVIAPDFSEEALLKLKKKKDRRLIIYHRDLLNKMKNHLQIQPCLDGYLAQMPDLVEDNVEEWTFPTDQKPSNNELDELKFAWQVVKMLKSNAICFTKNKQTLGLGIGQTSRISSLNIAVESAKRANLDLTNSVCASDGFFPFKDSIERLSEIGVKLVIQPGGSKADLEVIQACNKLKIAMVLTGRRHFRH
ncbi:MAG: bifunctional phosphoribosylaminoimidazolecarboxamide formyltransferase/IMP cyclohydrolase [Candidatus Cloacimonetes bacterium]|nr:bifunctional phosphoribosylaminoimidazolecarboxamide formyltransferase/IMP cyclohydrolase [Candidatus Cloacimonadota bacterium]